MEATMWRMLRRLVARRGEPDLGLYRGGPDGAYASEMAIARRPPVTPVPVSQDLGRYEGLWVAVKDGRVIEADETSSGLVYRLRQRGPEAKGAVMQRAPKRSDAIVVSLG
jgi:hypothetical protein